MYEACQTHYPWAVSFSQLSLTGIFPKLDFVMTEGETIYISQAQATPRLLWHKTKSDVIASTKRVME